MSSYVEELFSSLELGLVSEIINITLYIYLVFFSPVRIPSSARTNDQIKNHKLQIVKTETNPSNDYITKSILNHLGT